MMQAPILCAALADSRLPEEKPPSAEDEEETLQRKRPNHIRLDRLCVLKTPHRSPRQAFGGN